MLDRAMVRSKDVYSAESQSDGVLDIPGLGAYLFSTKSEQVVKADFRETRPTYYPSYLTIHLQACCSRRGLTSQ